MDRMFLPARVPNEGARRLARWIASLRGGLAAAAVLLNTRPEYLQRMIEGEMVPGLTTGTLMARAFGMRARDFNRPAAGWWFDAGQEAA